MLLPVLRRISWEWWLLTAVLSLRLLSMALLPLTDTSEARYGEIARLMAVSGDWITPWFKPGVPFWGKPPLAFWSEALAFRLLGINEFAARLPSWLATLATLAPIFALARAYYGVRAARQALLIYSTCALTYVLAGAVVTDPFLALGTTLSMTAFALAPEQPKPLWRYGFFVGLAIGLLAKGPLALVLVAGALLPWLLWHRRCANEYLLALPWARGSLLLTALTLPWYLAAEIKTPGFLYYFIIGEHFLRYLDPGWNGDHYGNAHIEPYGSIFLFWIEGALPWGIVGLWVLLRRLHGPRGRRQLRSALAEPRTTYLLAWSLFSLVFFSGAANIIWTYVLPALPALSILLAGYIDQRWPGMQGQGWRTPLLAATVTPFVVLMFTLIVLLQPRRLKTEKALVHYAERHSRPGDRLLFVEHRPFSARFYSRGTAELVSLERLPEVIATAAVDLHIAMPENLLDDVEARLPQPLRPHVQSRRYILITLSRESTAAASRSATPASTRTTADNG